MCRLAAYHGPAISLGQFLLTPAHGLMEQSWEPREMREGRLNADGYGFGWYNADGKPAHYVYPMPIWTDVNLEPLGRSLYSHQWLANVRSATVRMAATPFNTMPFVDGQLMFLHNGFIRDFARSLRPRFRAALDAEFDTTVQGNTDSEHLFALLRQLRSRAPGGDLTHALGELFKILDQWLDNDTALLNFVIGDGQALVAVRHAINGECPSLYYTAGEPAFPDAVVVASEPLSDDPSWQAVPPHTVVTFDHGEAEVTAI